MKFYNLYNIDKNKKRVYNLFYHRSELILESPYSRIITSAGLYTNHGMIGRPSSIIDIKYIIINIISRII